MTYLKRLAFAFVILFVCSSVQAQVQSADSMIQRLFSSLKNKDEKAFVTLYPNGKQMASLMRGMMESMFKSEEMQKMMAMDEKSKNMNIDSLIDAQLAQVTKPEAQAEMQKSFAKNFQEIIQKGESKGVNWTNAQLVKYTMDSSSADMQDEEMKMFASSGVKSMKGVIDFTSGGTDYQMNFEKVLYIPTEGGWFGGEFKQVIKKGETFTQEGNNETDTVDAPKEETKTKIKAENGKTKVKTEGNQTKTKTKTTSGQTKTKTKTKA